MGAHCWWRPVGSSDGSRWGARWWNRFCTGPLTRTSARCHPDTVSATCCCAGDRVIRHARSAIRPLNRGFLLMERRRRIHSTTSNQAGRAMSKKHFVYAYDSEPAIDRTTGFPRLAHSTFTSTSPASWSASEHSTFDQPSHSIDRVHARRAQRQNRYVIMTSLAAVTAVSTAVVAVLR